MSCSEECLCMLGEGCILEELVVAGGPSSLLPLAVDHLQRGHSDHTGRIVVL